MIDTGKRTHRECRASADRSATLANLSQRSAFRYPIRAMTNAIRPTKGR
jgi:hypothetical protein